MTKETILVRCPIGSKSGYGVHSRLIVNAILSWDKYDVKIIPSSWGNTPNTGLIDPKLAECVLREPLTDQPDIFIHIGLPNEMERHGKYNILISAVTESSVCSIDFIEGSNKADLVIVPSQFTKSVLEQTKIEKRDSQTQSLIETIECKKPIEVLFEGVDTNTFSKSNVKPYQLLNEELSKIKESFAFLFVGTWLEGSLSQDRKDVGMLIKVFMDTFKKKAHKNRPALILKTNGATFSEVELMRIKDKIEQIKEFIRDEGYTGTLPNVYILHGDLTDDEMNTLYNHSKVKAMVSFTKAEGYGLPLLEFTTTGKPVIVSNYSGHIDFLNKEMSFLLPGKLTPIDHSAANQWIIKDGEWFTVNYPIASQVLADCYENYDKFLEKSRKHPKFTKDNFSLTKMSEKFLDIIEKHRNFVPNTQKVFKLPQLKKI